MEYLRQLFSNVLNQETHVEIKEIEETTEETQPTLSPSDVDVFANNNGCEFCLTFTRGECPLHRGGTFSSSEAMFRSLVSSPTRKARVKYVPYKGMVFKPNFVVNTKSWILTCDGYDDVDDYSAHTNTTFGGPSFCMACVSYGRSGCYLHG